MLLLLAACPAGPAFAQAHYFNDGGTHTISDASYQAGIVYVNNEGCAGLGDCTPPGLPTHVNVVAGALVDLLNVANSSSIEFSGGEMGDLRAFHGSRLSITGGSVVDGADSAGYITLHHDAQLEMSAGDAKVLQLLEGAYAVVSGGSLSSAIYVEGDARAIVRPTPGNSVNGRYFRGRGNAQLILESGDFLGECRVFDTSTVVVAGGRFTSRLRAAGNALARVSGGDAQSFEGWESGRIIVYGSDFEVGGSPVPYGVLPGTSGTLSGTLASGLVFSTPYRHNGYDSDHTGIVEVRAVEDALLADYVAHDSAGVVLDDAFFSWANLLVRDFGCTGTGACNSLQAATKVTLEQGAQIGGDLDVYDDSSVRMLGGRIGGTLHAFDGSLIVIEGSDFEVDGAAVPFGPLSRTTGQLTGTLASGEAMDNAFRQGGGSYEGTILLVSDAGGTTLWNDGEEHSVYDYDLGSDLIRVRNVGCIGQVSLCTSPGDPTRFRHVSYSAVGDLHVFDSSEVELWAGDVWGGLRTSTSVEGVIRGGTVYDGLWTLDQSHIVWAGGKIRGSVRAHDTSVIEIMGMDFAVDGVPVPFGEITADSGRLTGTLSLGGAIDSLFYHSGASDGLYLYAGAIHLLNAVQTLNSGGTLLVDDDSLDLVGITHVRNAGCEGAASCPAPGSPTALEVTTGASLGGEIQVRDTSALTITGGGIYRVEAYDHATVDLGPGTGGINILALYDDSSAELFYWSVRALALYQRATATVYGSASLMQGASLFDDSVLTVLGGTVGGTVWAAGSAHLDVRGGRFVWVVDLSGQAHMDLSGGSLESGLSVRNGGTASISGGSLAGSTIVSGSLEITGGTISGSMEARGGETVIHGSDFAINGSPAEAGLVQAGAGNLTATLLSGDPLAWSFLRRGGDIELRVPEPDARVAGLAALLTLAVIRRRPLAARQTPRG